MVLITIVNGVYKPTYNWQHYWQPSFQCKLGDQKNKLSARTPVIRKSFTTTPLTNSCSLLAGFGPGWRIMKIFEDLTWEEFHAGYRTVRETRSRCLFPMFLPDRPWKYWMFFLVLFMILTCFLLQWCQVSKNIQHSANIGWWCSVQLNGSTSSQNTWQCFPEWFEGICFSIGGPHMRTWKHVFFAVSGNSTRCVRFFPVTSLRKCVQWRGIASRKGPLRR
jgi:hypothetical protein